MIEYRIKQIVVENIDFQKHFEEVDINEDLGKIGINSITFIKIIVAIESEFNIEFNDEDLEHRKFSNIKSIITYVKSMGI
jgi:acyl carrier protein